MRQLKATVQASYGFSFTSYKNDGLKQLVSAT